MIMRNIRSLFTLSCMTQCGYIAGIQLPAHRFAPCGATLFFFYGKKEKQGKKKTPAPDTMLSPVRLPHSLKRVVGFA